MYHSEKSLIWIPFFLKFTVICLNQFCNLENIVLAVKIVHFLNLVLKEIIEKIGGWIK